MTIQFKNRVWYQSSSASTGDFGEGSARTGFRTPTEAGLLDGQLVPYVAESADRTEWEVGLGTWNTTGPVLERTTIRQSSNSDAVVDFSTNPYITISPEAEDFRIPLEVDADFYVDATDGDDTTGDGSSGNPWQTIGFAVSWIYAHIDSRGHTCVINLAADTYSEGVYIANQLAGAGGIHIKGDETTPGNVIVEGDGFATIWCSGGADVKISGCKITNTTADASGGGLFPASNGYLEFYKCDFGNHGTGFAIRCEGGIANGSLGNGDCTISAGMAGFLYATLGGYIAIGGGTVTLSGTPAFSDAFARADTGGQIQSTPTWSGAGTGVRFSVLLGGIIGPSTLSLTHFPGNASGKINGGYYGGNIGEGPSISPAQITATQNDYAPTGYDRCVVIRIDMDASRSITGLQGGVEGRVVILQNITAGFILSLTAEDTNSSAANRFAMEYAASIGPGNAAVLRYSGTESRWKLLAYVPVAVTQTTAETGSDTTVRGWSALRVAQAIDAQAIDKALMTTRGDMIRMGAASPERFAKGSANTLLSMGANDPGWVTLSALFDAVISSSRGAINKRGSASWEALTIGSANRVLTSDGTDPSWAQIVYAMIASAAIIASGEFRSNTASKLLSAAGVWTDADFGSLSDAATIAIDMSTFLTCATCSPLTGNRTLGNPTNTKNGQFFCLKFTASTSTRTLALGSNWSKASAVESFPISITTSETVYVCGFIEDSTHVRVTAVLRF